MNPEQRPDRKYAREYQDPDSGGRRRGIATPEPSRNEHIELPRRTLLRGLGITTALGVGGIAGTGLGAAREDATGCACDSDAACEVTVPLCAAQSIDVGTVAAQVVNTDDGLVIEVRYDLDQGYELDESHLYVGKTCPEELLSVPGQFPFSGAADGRYRIPFEEVCAYEQRGGRLINAGNCGFTLGECIYVAAHAVVVRRDESGEAVWEETAWGDGCDGREFDDGRNWATYFTYTTAFCDLVPKTIFVGYEDLPIEGRNGRQNDYDYNDFLTRLDTDFDVQQVDGEFLVSEFTIEVLPRARGASFEHEFGLLFDGDTFCDGSYELTVFDETDAVVSSDSGTFVGGADNDFPLFNTGDAFLADATNIVDGEPCVDSLRTATLRISFDDPCVFDVDAVEPTQPNGSGLPFDPYLVPDQTGERVDAGDIRLLSVPDTWLWPLKEVPIWQVYDEVEDDGTGQPVFTTDTWFDGGFDPTLVYDAC